MGRLNLAPVDVKGRLTDYIQPAQSPCAGRAARPTKVSVCLFDCCRFKSYSARLIEGFGSILKVNISDRWNAKSKTRLRLQGTPIRFLFFAYKDRAVASSATGNRIGSQRDFRTALALCGKSDCDPVAERDIYISRAISGFLLGDLSSATNDCNVVPQFGGWPGHASSGGKALPTGSRFMRKLFVLTFFPTLAHNRSAAPRPEGVPPSRLSYAAKLTRSSETANTPSCRPSNRSLRARRAAGWRCLRSKMILPTP